MREISIGTLRLYPLLSSLGQDHILHTLPNGVWSRQWVHLTIQECILSKQSRSLTRPTPPKVGRQNATLHVRSNWKYFKQIIYIWLDIRCYITFKEYYLNLKLRNVAKWVIYLFSLVQSRSPHVPCREQRCACSIALPVCVYTCVMCFLEHDSTHARILRRFLRKIY